MSPVRPGEEALTMQLEQSGAEEEAVFARQADQVACFDREAEKVEVLDLAVSSFVISFMLLHVLIR